MNHTFVSCLFDEKYSLRFFEISNPKILFVSQEVSFSLWKNRRLLYSLTSCQFFENCFLFDNLSIIVTVEKNQDQFAFLQQAISKNPFWTQFFIWINFEIFDFSFIPDIVYINTSNKIRLRIEEFPQRELISEKNKVSSSTVDFSLIIGDKNQLESFLSHFFLLKEEKKEYEDEAILESMIFISHRKDFELIFTDKCFVFFNFFEYRIFCSSMINNLAKMRNNSQWEEIILFCSKLIQSFQNGNLQIRKRYLGTIVNELYMAYWYKPEKNKIPELIEFIRSESLVDYFPERDYLISNFSFSQMSIIPQKRKWKTRFVSFYIQVESGERKASDYIHKDCPLFKIEDAPVTIFIEEKYRSQIPNKPNFDIRIFQKEDLSLFEKHCTVDNENDILQPSTYSKMTRKYFIMTVTKFFIIQRYLEEFKEKNICWLDFGYRWGFPQYNLVELDEFSTKAFRCCFIQLQPFEFVNEKLTGLYENFCAGVMFGSKQIWKTICDEMLREFEMLISNGLGHTEEQILNQIFTQKPFLFDLNYALYSSVVENFVYLTQHIERLISMILNRSLEINDHHSLQVGWDFALKLYQSLSSGNLDFKLFWNCIFSIVKIGYELQKLNIFDSQHKDFFNMLSFICEPRFHRKIKFVSHED
jgi:hypothetical protein